MSMDIRLPNITASTAEGKLQQMQSYMYQLVEQLNWALNMVESAQSGNATPAVKTVKSESISPKEAEDTFNSIKALIIKSADIVKAYEDTILTEFNGKYFADSDFGTYIEETKKSVKDTSDGVLEIYKNIQTIDSRVEGVENEVITTNGYIKRGELGKDKNGNVIYGIEIGETNDNGFSKYARFTADKLSFFDQYGYEVAYIGAGCLYVEGKTVFRGEIQLGNYHTDTTDGLAFTWIEGG